MPAVEVFKTNVTKKAHSEKLLSALLALYPSCKMNFDLSDCDKVLRVEGDQLEASHIIFLVREYGFRCEVLE